MAGNGTEQSAIARTTWTATLACGRGSRAPWRTCGATAVDMRTVHVTRAVAAAAWTTRTMGRAADGRGRGAAIAGRDAGTTAPRCRLATLVRPFAVSLCVRLDA